jgi:hypothetical protein
MEVVDTSLFSWVPKFSSSGQDCTKLLVYWENDVKMDLKGRECESVAGQGPVADFCEHGNKLLGVVEAGEFLD